MFLFNIRKKTDEQNKRMILLGFILLGFIHTIFVFAGFYNNDDINYSRYAAGIASQGFSLTPTTDHFQLRWTIIYVTAFFYKLLGINAFTSSLSSFISIALCGFLLKKITHNYKALIFFLSLLFFFFGHSVLFYMHRLLPDSTICLASLWMYASYRSYTIKQQHPLSHAFQFSVAFLLAIITKETIIIVLPLFAVFFSIDIFKKQRLPFWLYVIPSAITLLFLYLLYFKLSTGSFFYRYQILQANSYFSGCSFDQLPVSYIVRRIGYDLWKAMLLNGDLLILLPALAAFIYRKKIQAYAPVYNMDFYAFIILLLAANFMTISFTTYVPLCHDPRHFLFLFPFAAILSGPLLFAYSRNPKHFKLLPLFLLSATVIMFYINAGTTKYLYLLFTVILILAFEVPALRQFKILPARLFFVAVTVLFSLNYFIGFIKPYYPFYWAHKKIVDRNFKNKNNLATIYSSDDLSSEMTEYFLQFNTGGLSVLPISVAQGTETKKTYYLLVGDLNKKVKVKMDSLIKKDSDPQVYLVDREDNVFLYEVNNVVLQELKATQLYNK